MNKCVIFKDIFPRLSKTNTIFQDFSVFGIVKKKIHDFPEGMGTLHIIIISVRNL